jgi:carbon storage regulator
VLVLSRKVGESLIIGNNITVTVVEFRGDQVRLGVDAPRSIQVYREELYAEVSRQNREAAAVGVDDLEALRRRVDHDK